MQETIDAWEYLWKMYCLGHCDCHLSRRRTLDQPHLTILVDFVCEVLPDVVAHPARSRIVATLDARGIVLVHRGRLLLRETKTVQNISSRSARR